MYYIMYVRAHNAPFVVVFIGFLQGLSIIIYKPWVSCTFVCRPAHRMRSRTDSAYCNIKV